MSTHTTRSKPGSSNLSGGSTEPQASGHSSQGPSWRLSLTGMIAALAVLIPLIASPAAIAAPPENAHGVLNRAFNALGGAEVLSSTSNLQIEATGETRVPFEGFDPGEAVSANTYSGSYSIDVEQNLIRVDVTRQPLFEVFQFFPEESFTIVANEEIGHLSDQALFTFPGDLATQNVTALWRQQVLFNPQLLMAAAAENPEIVSVGGITKLDGRTHRILTIDNDVAPIHLFMDNRSALISKLVTTESNPLVRDVTVEVHYRQWQQGQDMPYPAEVELVVDGMSLWEESRTAFSTPDELPVGLFDDLALADPTAFDPALAEYGRQSQHLVLAFLAAGFTFSPDQPIFGINELAPGIHHVATDTSSIIVEQADGLVLLEAPLSPAYGSTLVDIAGDTSDKPISHIIQSHHHVDHASGVRSVVATGAELVVGPGVGDLWDQVLTAESTIRPDALSETPVTVARHEVAEGSSLTLDDDLNAITTYSVPGPHARDMLVTAINTGEEIIVFNADLYNTGLGFTLALPGPSILFEALRTTGLLDADCNSELPMTIVPTHGLPLSLPEALAEVGASNVGC